MSKYIIILIWIGICTILSYSGRLKRREVVLGNIEVRFVPWFACLIFMPIIWMAANRGSFVDTGVYLHNFKAMPESFRGISEYMKGVVKDRGFSYISCLIKVFITHREKVYLGIIAIIQALSLIIVFRKYSINYIVSVFLFVVSTDYISWMFNGMRQFLAVSIILLATPLMLKKKYIFLFGIIIIASTIHFSALLMIPIVLLAQGKAWNVKTIIYIFLVIIAIVFVDKFTSLLDDSLSATQYGNVVSDYLSWNDDGTNILRVLVYSVPAIIGFFGRKYIDSSHDELINFCLNMSIVSAGIYFVSWATSGIFIGRLPIYTSLYGYILLPWEIENMFSYRSRRFVYAIMCIAYLVFYYYQMHFTWRIM